MSLESHNIIELDLTQLEMLSDDDPEFMEQILEMISEQSPEVIQDMKTQFSQKEFMNVKKTAHKYKSSVNILGNPVMTRILKELEDEATKGEDEGKIGALVQEFEQVCTSLVQQIDLELARLREAA
ncbi:MAG: Hpt domain-containing protein [Bacteroidota bacterium]